MAYAEVNGLSLGYEEYGSGGAGPVLVLLHGGLGTGDMFAPILPALAEGRRVVAVDMQGHGRTADVGRPLRFESMADDVAALCARLGSGPVDLLGYSLGGGVALRTAIQHPDTVRRLVLVSAPYGHGGWFPEVSAGMVRMNAANAESMKRSGVYQSYAAVAPRVEDWPVLVGKTGELVRRDYDWGAEVAAMETRALLVFADADSVRPAHMAEFYALLGGGLRDPGWEGSGWPARCASQLAVLPGATHYDIIASPLLPAVVNAFLGPGAPAGGRDQPAD